MLPITIPGGELWDEVNERFIRTKEQHLELEHSLVALSLWESKWHKPFLVKQERTNEEIIDYIRCMTLTKNVDENVYKFLTDANLRQVLDYLENPMTATTINEENDGKSGKEIVTAEIIYYWMITYNIPVVFEQWHLNRLLTLIKVCNIKNAPKKKRGKHETLSRHMSTNMKRRMEIKAAREKEGI